MPMGVLDACVWPSRGAESMLSAAQGAAYSCRQLGRVTFRVTTVCLGTDAVVIKDICGCSKEGASIEPYLLDEVMLHELQAIYRCEK